MRAGSCSLAHHCRLERPRRRTRLSRSSVRGEAARRAHLPLPHLLHPVDTFDGIEIPMASAAWLWLLALGAVVATVHALPTDVSEEAAAKKAAAAPAKPKVKRSQEELMFGNQQNRRAPSDSNADSDFSSPAEKRTLSDSGLEDSNESERVEVEQPKALPVNDFFLQQSNPSPNENKYEYGKVLVNEIGDVLPGGTWELPLAPYGRYYGEDRRKRSEEAAASASGAASTPAPITGAPPVAAPLAGSQSDALIQPQRSVPAYYEEPRYKRESDLDPEDFLALLSLYDSERRNRGNYGNYENDDFESIEDEPNMIALEEDPRVTSWLALGYPQQRYPQADPLLNSDLAALARNRPANYYDQYLGGQQYETGLQYGTPQYGLAYAQPAYYPPEKRFMVSKKRSQNYDSYGSRSGLMMNSRGYPSYQQRMFY